MLPDFLRTVRALAITSAVENGHHVVGANNDERIVRAAT
jgi:hypothetical protein